MADRSVSVRLIAIVDQYKRGMAEAAKATDQVAARGKVLAKIGPELASVGSTLTRNLTLPIVGLGVAAGKLSVDFEQVFARMVGLAGVAASEVDGLKDAVTDLAVATGRGPQDVALGLEAIRSAGFKGAEAMQVLDRAAKGATAGLGDTRVVANAVTNAIASYGAANITAARAGDILAATVREAKVEASQIAPQFGRLLPIAAELGVEFEEVGGSLAFLSRASGDAELSSTQLLGVLVKMLEPGEEGKKALDAIGMSAAQLRANVRDEGLIEALVDLRDKLAANGLALNDFSRDQQFIQGSLALTRDGARDVVPVLDAVANSVGALDFAFQSASSTEGFKIKQDLAELQAQAIELGEKLVPVARDVIGVITDLVEVFGDIPAPVQVALALMLAGVGPALKLAGAFTQLRAKLILLRAAQSTAAVEGVAAGTSLSSLGVAAAGMIAPVTAAAGVLWGLSEAWKNWRDDTRQVDVDIDAALSAGLGEVSSEFEKLAAQGIASAGQIDKAFELLAQGSLPTAKVTLLELSASGKLSSDQLERFAAILEHVSENARIGSQVWADATRFLRMGGAAAEETGDSFAELLGKMQGSTVAADSLTDALSGSLDPLFSMLDALQANADAQTAVTDAGRDAAAAHRDVAAAQVAETRAAEGVDAANRKVAEALAMTADEAQAAKDGLAGLQSELRGQTDPLFAMLDALEAVEDAQGRVAELNKAPETVGEARERPEQQADAALDLVKAARDVEQASVTLAGAIQTGQVTIDQASQSLADWVAQGLITEAQAADVAARFADAATQAGRLGGATAQLGIKSGIEAAKAKTAAEQADALAAAKAGVVDANGRLAEAHDGVAEAQARAEEADRKVIDANDNVARTALAVELASIELAGAVHDGSVKLDDAKGTLREWAAQGLITEEQARRLGARFDEAGRKADELAGRKIVVVVEADTSLAEATIAAFWQKIVDLFLPGSTTVRPTGSPAPTPAAPATPAPIAVTPAPVITAKPRVELRAAGGPVYAGATYWVGEQGPEPVMFGANGRMLSHGEAMASLGAGGTSDNSVDRSVRVEGGVHVHTRTAWEDQNPMYRAASGLQRVAMLHGG